MGEPVRIVDLARDLIRLSGFEVDDDINIEFSLGFGRGRSSSRSLGTDAEKNAPHQPPEDLPGHDGAVPPWTE